MTPTSCKKVVKAWLDEHQLPYTKLTARTIDFTDLARATCIFVTVHGWQPNPLWGDLEALAITNEFRVQAS